MYDNRKFFEAKAKCEEAIDGFEQSIKICPTVDATKGIEDATSFLAKCDIGIQAEQTYDNAISLFTERKYEKAIEEFEKAKSLYDEIGYTAKVHECTAKIEESTMWIALRNKATQEFQQAEEAFSTAPSTFSAAGYENAQGLFEQAKSLWEEYDDPAQVRACEEYITQCERESAQIRNRVIIVCATALVPVVLAAVIIFMRRSKRKVSHKLQPSKPQVRDPLATIAERYARGEITKEEYKEMVSTLKKD